MRWLLAPVYDRFVEPTEEASFRGWRRGLLAPLSGSVLDLGAGTGANIEQFPATVDEVTFVEPDPGMRKRLEHKLDAAQAEGRFAPGSGRVVDAGSAGLPFPDDTFDAAVTTLVLCTVDDPAGALRELRRVLVPGGRLVFMEHVAAEDRPDRLKWQRRLTPVWRWVAGGCHLDRRTEATIADAGFTVDEITRESARKAAPVMRATIRGRATAPA